VQATIAAATRAQGRQPAWINLEYLTAESFAERNHGLPSPVLTGPAAGLTKQFFYPGFNAGTGGLLREQDLVQRQLRFDPAAWLQLHGVVKNDATLVSLFCYEPPGLAQLLRQFARGPARTQLLVTPGRPAAAVKSACEALDRRDADWSQAGRLEVISLPLLSQLDFDQLLWACDVNFVRGEDSLVRALWAGKPLVWNIYPQQDDAHHAKLAAFLDWLEAPTAMREFHLAWNGFAAALPEFQPEIWAGSIESARDRLLGLDDLVTQLMRFVTSASGS
jgi:uncharacterized repeat protein (TIGR03837 family)